MRWSDRRSLRGAVIDYRENFRARRVLAPVRMHLEGAGKRRSFRALRIRDPRCGPEEFNERLRAAMRERIVSLIGIAAKAGKTAAGYSAVRDALDKDAVELLLFASDLSDGTREKIGGPVLRFGEATLFTKDEMGSMLGREMVGIVGILDKGFAEAVHREAERLKGLRKEGQ
jgi:ribosomal protein L7Ae-like RNA K-turn-binding protein